MLASLRTAARWLTEKAGGLSRQGRTTLGRSCLSGGAVQGGLGLGYRLERVSQSFRLLTVRPVSFAPIGAEFILDVAEHRERVGADVIKGRQWSAMAVSSRRVLAAMCVKSIRGPSGAGIDGGVDEPVVSERVPIPGRNGAYCLHN